MRRLAAVGLRLLLAHLVLGAGRPAAAQGVTNYNDVILGARASALGGAFTAVADDTTASLHNPAGLADAPTRGLSLSVSAYGFQRQRLDDVIASATDSIDLRIDSLLVYPGATAYVLPLRERGATQHTLAFSILAPRFFDIEGLESIRLTDEGFDIHVFRSRTQRMFQAGPSYAVRVGPVAVGASLFGQYATFDEKRSMAASVEIGPDSNYRLLDFRYTDGSYYGLTGVLGGLVDIGQTSRLGLSIQLPSLRLGGRTRSYFAEATSFVALGPDGRPTQLALYQDVFTDVRGETVVRTPWVITTGWMQRLGDHVLSADIDLYLPVDRHRFLRDRSGGEIRPSTAELPGLDEGRGFDARVEEPARRWVMNASLGAELQLGACMALLLGLYTDFSNVGGAASEIYADIDLFGASLGVSRQSEDGSRLTVGLTGRYGRGKIDGVRVEDGVSLNSRVDARQWSLSLVVGGSRALQESR